MRRWHLGQIIATGAMLQAGEHTRNPYRDAAGFPRSGKNDVTSGKSFSTFAVTIGLTYRSSRNEDG